MGYCGKHRHRAHTTRHTACEGRQRDARRRAQRERSTNRADLKMSAADAPCPKFDANGSRYDQSTFAGRLAFFRELTDLRTLFVSGDELKQKIDLLDRHAKGQAAGVSDAELWDAKRVKDAVIHPTTGEEMFLPGRMSAFVPVNTVPTVGMLIAKSPMQTVFWQWANQSVNVMCNYVNRSGATVEWSQIGSAYALAVAASCGIAVGARKLVESGPPAVKRLGIAVPYMAVVAAGGANVAFTRMPEMQSGVPIADAEGNVLGVSKAAAITSVTKTIMSRNVCLPIAPMLLPPLAMAAIRTAVPLTGIAALAAETCLTAGSIYGALPVAIAIFPAQITIPTSALEPEFQNLRAKDGSLITQVVCNKGL